MVSGPFPTPIIMMDDDLNAGEVVADAEKEGAGAVREGHRFRFIRHPFAQPAEELVGDFLSDEYFHNRSSGLLKEVPPARRAPLPGAIAKETHFMRLA